MVGNNCKIKGNTSFTFTQNRQESPPGTAHQSIAGHMNHLIHAPSTLSACFWSRPSQAWGEESVPK